MRRKRALREGPTFAVELACMLAVALVGIAPAMRPGHVVGDGVDMYGTWWFYWWMRRCVEHLANPGFTDLFFFPLGKDVFAHTGDNLVDAVFSIPFQWVFGFPGYTRFFVVAVLVADGLAFRVLARGLFRSRWAAFAATLAWVMNPYLLFEITCGRITQAFLPFLPLAIHFLLRCEEEDRWRPALLAGAFTALQAWTYWFMGWFMALAFAWLGGVALWRSPGRRRLLLARYAMAGAVCGVLVAPALVPMALAAARGAVPGVVAGEGGSLFSLPPHVANNVADTLHGYLLMETQGVPLFGTLTYGLPLALWLLLGPGRLRFGGVLVLELAFALGPAVDLGGGRTFGVPWYVLAWHLLPFFDRLWFPYRMVSVAMVPGALAFGFLVERLLARDRLARAVPALLVLFACLTGLEQHRFRVYPFATADLEPPRTMRWIAREGGALIHLPYGQSQPEIVWQIVHGQPVFGGMGENAALLWPKGFRERLRNGFVRALAEACRTPARVLRYRPEERRELEEEGFRWVVLRRDVLERDLHHWVAHGRPEPGPAQIRSLALGSVDRLVELLGEPAAVEDSRVTWELWGGARAPEPIRYTPGRLAFAGWPREGVPSYERALGEAGRLHQRAAPGMGGQDLRATERR